MLHASLGSTTVASDRLVTTNLVITTEDRSAEAISQDANAMAFSASIDPKMAPFRLPTATEDLQSHGSSACRVDLDITCCTLSRCSDTQLIIELLCWCV